ncbi:MAG: 30S ribosomal protein S8 [Dehalococcoidia bacterium]|mgnify:FL=1|nr:30S ribosomal protein S8 [Dehalococcoidia bacterium]|tara:strand:- start:7 stop:399 length:393 start_codon:yes stop_codon:yes gene_type:complete
MTDPISDMLTRIRNGHHAKKMFVEVPSSKIKTNILKIFLDEGFINGYEQNEIDNKGVTKINLKYGKDEEPMILGLKRVSRPGLRNYVKKGEIPIYLGGMAVSLVSTSRGIMTGKEAFKNKLGGELICYLW